MWTCVKCSTRLDDTPEVCPSCGSSEVATAAIDETSAFDRARDLGEAPTEYDVHEFPDPGPAIVECYIAVSEAEASTVAARLRDLLIPVSVTGDAPEGEAPVHRVRVPIVDLGRALAVIDLLQKRRPTRP